MNMHFDKIKSQCEIFIAVDIGAYWGRGKI